MDRRRVARLAFKLAAATTEATLLDLVGTMKRLPADERVEMQTVVLPMLRAALSARAAALPLDDLPEARRAVERLIRRRVGENLAILAAAVGEVG